jgi:hypothetical protein
MGSGNGPSNEPKIILTANDDTVCNGILHIVDNVILPEEKYWKQYHHDDDPYTKPPYKYNKPPESQHDNNNKKGNDY